MIFVSFIVLVRLTYLSKVVISILIERIINLLASLLTTKISHYNYVEKYHSHASKEIYGCGKPFRIISTNNKFVIIFKKKLNLKN
jgi:hypothetical protein